MEPTHTESTPHTMKHLFRSVDEDGLRTAVKRWDLSTEEALQLAKVLTELSSDVSGDTVSRPILVLMLSYLAVLANKQVGHRA
jgi:hypothetical protein